MKKTAVIICPGRGTYNKAELGYLQRHHTNQSTLISQFDAFRDTAGQASISALDGAARFLAGKHTRGDNASPLIYAASYLDVQVICDEYDVLAITGNSMGWYVALAVAGAVSPLGGLEIVNTMGTLMHTRLIGGQTLYPFVDDNWTEIPGQRDRLLDLVLEINTRADHVLDVSIHLGGMLVLAGNSEGLSAFEAVVPSLESRYPIRLPNHAAFHTDLQTPVAEDGQNLLGVKLFTTPYIPLVDGKGAVWYSKFCNSDVLRQYTLAHQVTETYDFTLAVEIAAKTFAPDVFIITGPGTTLGGAVAQSLIGIGWEGLKNKKEFQSRQSADPLLISMGRDDQRHLVTKQ